MCEDFKGLCIPQMKRMELSSVVNIHKSNFRGGVNACKVNWKMWLRMDLPVAE